MSPTNHIGPEARLQPSLSRRRSFMPKQEPDENYDKSHTIKHVVRRASTRFNQWASSSFKHGHGRGREDDSIPAIPRSRSQEVDRPNLSAPQSKVDLPSLDTKRSSSLPGNFPELIAATEGGRTRISPVTQMSPSNYSSPSRKDSAKSDPVDEMVQAALKASSKLQTYVSQAMGQRLVDTAGGMRITHTRDGLVWTLSSKEAVRHRLLFVCACLSLAADFQEFQRRQARKSRHHQRKESIDSPLSPLGMMSGAKQRALEDFVASQAPIDDAERADLEAAVVVGTKTQIVNAIGQSLHLGNSFGLMCAFEARRLSDLSYGKFPELRMLLREHAAPTERIRSFSSTMDPWWSKQFDDYHKHYTSIRSKAAKTVPPELAPSTRPVPKLGKISRAMVQGVRPASIGSRSETSTGRRKHGGRSPLGSLRRVSTKASRIAGRRPGQGRPSLDKPLPPPAPAPEVPRRSSQRPVNASVNTPRSRYSLQAASLPSGGARRKGSVPILKPKSPPQTPSGTSESHIASQFSKSSTSSTSGRRASRKVSRGEGEHDKRRLDIHPAVAADVEGRIETFLHELQSQLWGSLRVDPRLVPLQTVAPAKA